MPEEIKSDPTAQVTSHETVVNTKLTTEAIDSNGKDLPGNSNLASIFDKIEAGTDSKTAVSEVMDKAKPEAKEIKVVSSHPDKKEEVSDEVKAEEKAAVGLDAALDKGQESQSKAEDKQIASDKKDDEEVPENELMVLPHDKPKTAKRISALLQKAAKINEELATTKKEKEERDAKLKELETKLGSVKTVDPKTEEEVNKKLEELAMFRRKYDLEKDPAIKSKYDDRISAAENAIPAVLQKNGAGEGLLNIIKEEGGWAKFSQSNRLITLQGGDQVSAAELADSIVSKLPYADRNLVNSITMEQIQLKREKERFVEEEVKVASDFFKKRDEMNAQQASERDSQIKAAQESISKWHKDVTEKNEFLKEKQIPSTASAEEKKAIEEDNVIAKQLNSVLAKNLGAKDLDGMLGIILESVQYHKQRLENAKLMAKTQKLEADLKAKSEELDNFKKSGKTTPRGGSISGGGQSAAQVQDRKPKTIEDAFSTLEAGKELE